MAERIDEAKIASAVETYLFDAGGTATIAQIRRALPMFASLSFSDRRHSPTRPGEEVWEQQVRNIVCHRDVDGNPVNSGRIIWTPGRLSLATGPQGSLFPDR